MANVLEPRGELTPGLQLLADAVASLVRHTNQQIDAQELIAELLISVKKFINDPRTELPDDERLLANLSMLGFALLNRR